MSFSNSPEVGVIGMCEDLVSLMDESIMNQRVTNAIKKNAKTNPEAIIISPNASKNEKKHRRNCKHQEECVVLLDNVMLSIVVVLMQYPEKSMHYILMQAPGHKFHDDKRSRYNANNQPKIHLHYV